MKIAARGFYFYIEIAMAVIILVVLLVAVNEKPEIKEKEFLYYDMPNEVFNMFYAQNIEDGLIVIENDTEFEAKAISFDVTNEETGDVKSYDFGKETYMFKTYKQYDEQTGKLIKTLYIADDEDSMIHLSYTEKKIGATTLLNDDNEIEYKYFIQGFETTRLKDLLYILHNESGEDMLNAVDSQVIRELEEIETLNNRQNMVPIVVVFLGSLMGFFIVMAYIFLDKAETV